jgi:hypothetical protein
LTARPIEWGASIFWKRLDADRSTDQQVCPTALTLSTRHVVLTLTALFRRDRVQRILFHHEYVLGHCPIGPLAGRCLAVELLVRQPNE